ncbi:hypothetical protein [Halomonas sp. Cn5-12]|jgi:hypothetical protein|uniref:hypothetical protein n=1 Tax=Halomonas sp. Cn5-12 TaxID=2908885 RepID=UPI001F3A09B0|nr:hypothetical protein [Halomonas sp. Cn5-12]MCF2911913.1 hypothetical protein [Halomonas sp. Cn5-12]
MKLTLHLSPVARDNETTMSIRETTLFVNGISYDLSDLPDGATAFHPELGKVTRQGSEYECMIILGHGPNAPHETRFPAPIVLENHHGPIELPLYDVVPEPENEVTE